MPKNQRPKRPQSEYRSVKRSKKRSKPSKHHDKRGPPGHLPEKRLQMRRPPSSHQRRDRPERKMSRPDQNRYDSPPPPPPLPPPPPRPRNLQQYPPPPPPPQPQPQPQSQYQDQYQYQPQPPPIDEEMRIDMHVLENIDTNPKISIEKLSYELNVSREDVLASIRRLRSDRRRFQQVQHEVEKKRFHKVIEDGTKNIDNDDYSAEY